MDEQACDADGLLDREVDEEYRREWTELLMREKEKEDTETFSVVLFRLSGEWFALDTVVFKEVCDIRAVHQIPSRSDSVLRGVVNLRGQLRLCVSLHNLLGVPYLEASEPRMVVVEQEESIWVFAVDEMFGVQQLVPSVIQNVPVTVLKSTANYLKGIFEWEDRHVNLIDAELLLRSLERSIL